MSDHKYSVAGYVKLAKLWERRRNAALEYHNAYFAGKFRDSQDYTLQGVYVDITGCKEIRKRPAMLRLLHACRKGDVNCISTPAGAYLAANSRDFNYLLHFLFSLGNRVDIVTEDDHYQIDKIRNEDQQWEALQKMAADFVSIEPGQYEKWKNDLLKAINDLTAGDEDDVAGTS